MRTVDTHQFTRLTDQRVAKSYLIDEYALTPFIIEGAHVTDRAACCGISGMVQTVHFGRLRNVEVCDRCLAHESNFLQSLAVFDETEEFGLEEQVQDLEFKKLQEEDLTREQKKAAKVRADLESAGQMRLF